MANRQFPAGANRRFPRNNNRNNSRSNNDSKPKNNAVYCPQCSQEIRLIDGDIQLSLNLHMQSHIDQDTNRQHASSRFGPNIQRNVQSNYVCPECNENVQIFDNDYKRAFELHAQTHKRSGVGTRGDDQSSTSSGRSRSSNRRQNHVRNNTGSQPDGMNVLDSTFYKMPPGLKAHRGFVYESESGEVACGLCNVKIVSFNKIDAHLKTKSHEDNTIAFIKSKLPSELPPDTIEFVSFYGSNLCCNLCRCKIYLNSMNLSETMMNIIVHNAGQQHVGKKGRNVPDDRFKDGMKKVNYLASKDILIFNNKHLISCGMQPQFKCKLCDKLIQFDQNDQTLLKNFISHFSSNSHNKCARATSVLTSFKSTYQPKGGKHNLVVTKGSITCTVCNTSLDASLESLDAHVNEIEVVKKIDWPEDLSERINNMDLKGPQQSFTMKGQSDGIKDDNTSTLSDLLKCMPLPFTNVNYIVESSQGHLTCLVCNCNIPFNFNNLKTHLLGGSHTKNVSSNKDVLGEVNPPLNSLTTTSVKSQNFNPFIKETSSPSKNAMSGADNGTGSILNYLKTSDPLIRQNVNLLTKCNDNVYSCKLCKLTIPKASDVESFKQELITHLSSSNHKQLYASKQESEMTKLLTHDPLVRANKNYLQMVTKIKPSDTDECNFEKTLLCTLCNSQLPFSVDETKLKKTLAEHLTGSQHISAAGETKTDQGVPKSAQFLSNSGESLKAQYERSKAIELADSAKKSSTLFEFPVEQFKGPQSLTKAEESTNRSPKPSLLFSNPTDPFTTSGFATQAKTSNMFQTPPVQLKELRTSSKLSEKSKRPNKLQANFTEPFTVIEFTDNANKSSNLIEFPFEQLKESQSLSKAEESTNRSQTFLFSNPTNPFPASKLATQAATSNTFQTRVEPFKGLQTSEESQANLTGSTVSEREQLFIDFETPDEQFKGPLKSSKSSDQLTTEPLRGQTVDMKPKELNFKPTKPTFPNQISIDPIIELFQKLPPNFQSDVAFITKSESVDGFLGCTICNVHHINPPYLQNHLEEEKHKQGKMAHGFSSAQTESQNTASKKKVMNQVKNWFGLSN